MTRRTRRDTPTPAQRGAREPVGRASSAEPEPGEQGTVESMKPGPVAVGDRLELTVGPVAHGGHCVARHHGRVVFVRHTLPGERVRATVTEVKSRYLRADAVEVLEAVPERVAPPCPYAGPGRCGGCDFQHVDPATQRRLKADVVRELLVRIGGLSPAEVADLSVEELPGGPLGWRSRVRYAITPDGRAGLRRHRSHQVLPIDRCLIAAPEIQDASVTHQRWPEVDAVEVVAGSSGTTVCTYGRPDSRDRDHHGEVTVVDGPATVVERAVGRQWRLAPEAFWQVHPAAADIFAECVVHLLRPRPGETAWDLYGGAGLFAAALAAGVGPGGRVVSVESDPACDPRGNLADLPQVHVARGRVERVLRRRGMRRADLVVLDPPRSGAGADVVGRISAAGPRAVAYVACDPAALARDVKTFREAGFTVSQIRAFDAFPMTHHVECIALLTPAGA